jgi:mono/diheme cytochrome c family protein
MRSAALLIAAAMLSAQSPKYGVGRAPTGEEVRQWDISVSPDGKGLPAGKGTAAEGAEMFANRCARCHGPKGEGKESVALAGGQGTLKGPKPLRTVGSYWPQATTIFDYVSRAMPFDKPGTLGATQTYSLTAYVLYLNGLVKDTDVIDANTLPKIRMPNRDGFVKDPRPDIRPRMNANQHE